MDFITACFESRDKGISVVPSDYTAKLKNEWQYKILVQDGVAQLYVQKKSGKPELVTNISKMSYREWEIYEGSYEVYDKVSDKELKEMKILQEELEDNYFKFKRLYDLEKKYSYFRNN